MSAETTALIKQGREAETKLDRARAIEAYQKAQQADPANREVAFRLSYNLDLAGEEEQALSVLEAACAEPKPSLNALVNLALLYEDAGQYAKAERCLKLVLDTDPNHTRARLFLKDVQASRQMFVEDEPRTREYGNPVLNTPVTDFELSARARNCLKKMNIKTLGDLLRISEAELLAYKSFGETTLMEIKGLLSAKGLKLGQALDQQRSATREQVYQQVAAAGGEEAVGVLQKPVDDLDLSVRARKAVSLLGISTIGDLVSRTEAELLGIKNFGATSLDEIKAKLTELGLSLRQIEGE